MSLLASICDGHIFTITCYINLLMKYVLVSYYLLGWWAWPDGRGGGPLDLSDPLGGGGRDVGERLGPGVCLV